MVHQFLLEDNGPQKGLKDCQPSTGARGNVLQHPKLPCLFEYESTSIHKTGNHLTIAGRELII